MKILAIETSCDETSAAVVQNGTSLLSNVIASSVDLQKKFGGVVPEVAAREQIKLIIPVIGEALAKANTDLEEIDAIAVTYGPGLIGSLLVGVETAKTLALIFKKPLVPINHLIGHFYANWIGKETMPFPQISLIVSGGHTDLVYFKNHRKFLWLGGTRDDAAGEVFDKVARLFGLSYPGGPEIEKAAKSGNPKKFSLPRPMLGSGDFDFSFSGLKTAVVNLWKNTQINEGVIFDMSASFQEAICEVLVKKTIQACLKFKVANIAVGGGVAANQYLKTKMIEAANPLGIEVSFPQVALAIDNAAMIAAAAYFNYKPKNILEIQAKPELHF